METDLPSDRFEMALLGCRSLVLIMNNYNIKNRPYRPLQCTYPTSHDRHIFGYNS